MSLHEELVEQAEHLATKDRRLKQASLRRSISAAYYALYHLLTGQASAQYVAGAGLQARINRTHSHADLRRSAERFVQSNLPRGLRTAKEKYTVPAPLKTVAQAFIDLQAARHKAEYDLEVRYKRQQALELVSLARRAFAACEEVKNTDDARLFLACFLLWDRWDKEPC